MIDLSPDVAKIVSTYPADARDTFFLLRKILLNEASLDEKIGPIEETLK